MRFLTIMVFVFFLSPSLFAKNANEAPKVETFFKSYLLKLRVKDFEDSKKMMTEDYLKKLGGDSGLKRLLEMQDGKEEAPKVKLIIEKGIDDIYLIEIKDALVKHSEYLFKVRKVNGEFKVDGTVLKEE